MKVINWNICCMKGNVETKVEFLKSLVEDDSFIIIMQEVKPKAFSFIKLAFDGLAHAEYSLFYRQPGKFDTESRRLGIAILVSRDVKLKFAQVLNRALMPDRTLMVDVENKGNPLRVMGLHSITGCDHKKAKELQFFAFAEAVDEYRPDIVGIDANEPRIDHYDIERMCFFDNRNKGDGCRTFFKTMHKFGIVDAFARDYDQSQWVDGQCLEVSHKIKVSGRPVRYDFLFVNSEKFKNYKCSYDLEASLAAGSDHSVVILEPKTL